MDRIIRTGASLALSIGVAMTAASTASFAQANCEIYGKLAVKQAQANTKQNCGFKGPRWTSDHKAHTTWCGTVGPTEWRSELKKRADELKKCKKAS